MWNPNKEEEEEDIWKKKNKERGGFENQVKIGFDNLKGKKKKEKRCKSEVVD